LKILNLILEKSHNVGWHGQRLDGRKQTNGIKGIRFHTQDYFTSVTLIRHSKDCTDDFV
jgi:hypothetical protein